MVNASLNNLLVIYSAWEEGRTVHVNGNTLQKLQNRLTINFSAGQSFKDWLMEKIWHVVFISGQTSFTYAALQRVSQSMPEMHPMSLNNLTSAASPSHHHSHRGGEGFSTLQQTADLHNAEVKPCQGLFSLTTSLCASLFWARDAALCHHLHRGDSPSTALNRQWQKGKKEQDAKKVTQTRHSCSEGLASLPRDAVTGEGPWHCGMMTARQVPPWFSNHSWQKLKAPPNSGSLKNSSPFYFLNNYILMHFCLHKTPDIINHLAGQWRRVRSLKQSTTDDNHLCYPESKIFQSKEVFSLSG